MSSGFLPCNYGESKCWKPRKKNLKFRYIRLFDGLRAAKDMPRIEHIIETLRWKYMSWLSEQIRAIFLFFFQINRESTDVSELIEFQPPQIR